MRMKQVSAATSVATCFMLAYCLAYSSSLEMEEICSLETSVDFNQSVRRYIRCENLKSYCACITEAVEFTDATMLSYY
jgi:hypothetical protein